MEPSVHVQVLQKLLISLSVGRSPDEFNIVQDERTPSEKSAHMRLRHIRDGVEHLHRVLHDTFTDVGVPCVLLCVYR